MFSTLRTRFGIPGVISVMALVFAMFGGAYAANNSSDAGSSDAGKATASAKAKKGPRGPKGNTGPAGPQGPAGPAGAKGDAGAAGSNGSNGGPGEDGTSVTGKAITGGVCGTGVSGVEYTSATGTNTVCNGKNGTNGTSGFTETLPEGMTETGAWSIAPVGAGGLPVNSTKEAALTFAIPLENEIAEDNVHVLAKGFEGTPGEDCPGKASDPEAAEGHLCVYVGADFVVDGALPEYEAFEIRKLTPWEAKGVSTAGAVLAVAASAGTGIKGSWAVTAP